MPQLRIMSVSPEAGVHIVSDQDGRQYFVMGHSEYDTETLGQEYRRDLEKGEPIAMPKHYYPGDDPSRAPVNNWRATGQLLYTNWLNYFVYQTTPFDLRTMGNDSLDCAML